MGISFLTMRVLGGGFSVVTASDDSVKYEITRFRNGTYSVIKYRKGNKSGEYITFDVKGKDAAVKVVEDDFGSPIRKVSKPARRTSEQKRRDNFVLYD